MNRNPSQLKRIFDFFIFSSLFISLCAVAMGYQTYVLFDRQPSPSLLWFIFFGTLTSYSFHWYLTPPKDEGVSLRLRWLVSNKMVHLIFFILGLVGSLILFLDLVSYWFWLGCAVFLAFLYSAPKVPHPLFYWLRKIAIGKTIFLSFAWTLVTSTLPLAIPDTHMGRPEIVFMVNQFFLIYAICILFDYRDRQDDRNSGIRSLITYLDEKGIDRLFWFSMLIFLLTLFYLSFYFGILITLALGLTGVVLGLLYYPSKRNFSDYRYYFVLDGLMMLSAPLVILIKFAR